MHTIAGRFLLAVFYICPPLPSTLCPSDEAYEIIVSRHDVFLDSPACVVRVRWGKQYNFDII